MEELKEKLKNLRGIFGLRKLHKVGDSYMLTVPKEWVMLFALRDEDDSFWVIASYESGQIIIRPVDKSIIESMRHIKEG